MPRTRRAIAHGQREWFAERFREWATAAGVKEPKAMARALIVLFDGAIAGSHFDGRSERATLDGWPKVVGRLNARIATCVREIKQRRSVLSGRTLSREADLRWNKSDNRRVDIPSWSATAWTESVPHAPRAFDERDQIALSGLHAVVSRNFTSWNQLDGWLQQVDVLRRAA